MRWTAVPPLLAATVASCHPAPTHPERPSATTAVTLALTGPIRLTIRTATDSTISFHAVRSVEGRVVQDSGGSVTLRLGRLALGNGQTVPYPGATVIVPDSVVRSRATPHGGFTLVIMSLLALGSVAAIAVGGFNRIPHF